jgi:hypothetical protein
MANLLYNPNFALGTYEPYNQTSLVLPVGWEAGALDEKNVFRLWAGDRANKISGATIIGTMPTKFGPRARNNMAVMLRPEILTISRVQPYLAPPRIPEGYTNAVTGFKQWGTMCWWLRQVVAVIPGATYRLTAQAHAWAHADGDPDGAYYSSGVGTGAFYADESAAGVGDGKANFRFRLGLDADGRDSPFLSGVTFGPGAHIYNVYHAVPQVVVEALGHYMTVYLCCDNLWGFTNSNSFYCAPVLEMISGPAPEPTVDYVVIVNLLPQDATKAEKAKVLDQVHNSKQTILQSADDALRLVESGLPGSKVRVWGAARWGGTNKIMTYLSPCAVEFVEF